MDLAEHLLKTLQDIDELVDLAQINLRHAEQLYILKLVEAPNGTDYQITAKGREVLKGYR
jgi:hypothetical protein